MNKNSGLTWSETTPDLKEYYICIWKKCNKYPAFSLFEDIEFLKSKDGVKLLLGPYCEEHWVEFARMPFRQLEKDLENETWGSSPELRGQI